LIFFLQNVGVALFSHLIVVRFSGPRARFQGQQEKEILNQHAVVGITPWIYNLFRVDLDSKQKQISNPLPFLILNLMNFIGTDQASACS
jgi:hypothetical protein